ncbi:sodium/glutamate symporter [Burkholderia sp. MSMB1826]|nr:sodium/glutamate symporter [Burkholderia sp. MSMB1826]
MLFVGVVFSNGLSLFGWRSSEHAVSLLGNVSLALLMTLPPW